MMTGGRTYSARELAELAGTTVRTIHYYTAEGLLPAPQGSTRGATYTPAHLARLQIIAALREEGMALTRIRERLTPLTDEQALRIAQAVQAHQQAGQPGGLSTLGLIDLELAREQAELPSRSSLPGPSTAQLAAPPPWPASASDYVDRILHKSSPGVYDVPPSPLLQAPARRPVAPDKPELWYEYELDDGVILRLRQDRYRQMPGKPHALIEAVRRGLRRNGLLTNHRERKPETPPE